jgi:hypothetical protein
MNTYPESYQLNEQQRPWLAEYIATHHDVEEEPTPKHVEEGSRVIAKFKTKSSYYFSGTVVSVNRFDNTCEIRWDDNQSNLNSTTVKFEWMRISRDVTTAAHKDVGKNKGFLGGMVGDMWDGGDHRFKDLDAVINSYSPPLNVIKIK